MVGRFGHDLKNSGKTCRYVWASFLSRTNACNPFVFLKVAQKFGRIKKFPPLNPKVPVYLWLEVCTMICWGASLSAVIRGITPGVKGHNSMSAESLGGRRKVLTMSHVHSSIQYICFRKTSGSKMGAPNLLLAQAPFNLVTPLSVWRLLPSRNSSTHLYVAKLRCSQTAETRTALAIALKFVSRFHFGGL